ncbi:alpha-1,4-glucan--maltose-1-phosphate maltosyltransferase [Mucilaginibacter gotjawali]|uniref:Alpha-1,4-glucan:maltose-1-phosphate maltosyltransferase n=2 Tax=Mucilaginibacter gotjawali TaxID=1550579 RepID=A0A0X8X4E0_9SPHI|nr:alpha-1,4-glucan--maltose-1-phosphate maltosyltransferase [Mucilaginibacter gotjawali]MBB3055345.1 starch synthase (maltosyl-transferring) [Mucilaginibacter gotjawali]BAU53379.1 Alpha-1,4-glucan:maltose-1-phosphate maltosyltransferase 1 [Mucilaginibacter gotjawali]
MTEQGLQRVIVEHVTPEIDAGRFYIKKVAGESIEVEADIFTDGHDHIGARLLYRHENDKTWLYVPMHMVNNDRWRASFDLEKAGFYYYTVTGWVDHADTWHHGFLKKYEDAQHLNVELLIGAELLEAMLPAATKADQKRIGKLITLMRDEKNYEQAVAEVLGKEIHHYISTYPNLDNATIYTPHLKVLVERDKALFSSWYCFFPRSASRIEGKHGTFKDCEALLPRVAEMGFDVLYFPPIHPIGHNFRKGKNNAVNAMPGDDGVPYAIGSTEGGHKDVLKDLGTLQDFKHLIKEAASHGLEIAMDFAIQCSPDHPYVKKHPKWFKWRPDGTVQYAENPPKKYQDILPINFENDDWQNLWTELKSILDYWCEQGIRIFRVDNPHTKSFHFWEWCIAEVQKKYPGTLFLSEAFTKPKVMKQLAKLGYTQSYTYYVWRNTKHELIEYMNELTQTEMKDYFRPNFWPNTHDINPYSLQNGNEPGFITRFFMAATLSSNYGIFGPVYELMYHAPYPGKEEYLNSEKYEVRYWDWEKRNKLIDVITRVNAARKVNPALQHTNNITFCEIHNDQLLAYYKKSGDNHILCVVNLDPNNRQWGLVQTPLHALGLYPGQDFIAFDILTGRSYNWNQEWNYVELDPHDMPVHLFKIELL